MPRLQAWALEIRRDVHAVYLASRDPRVPRHAKVLSICITAYALSPIDLIPDFIPVLGYVDDLILVPLGILLVLRMIPKDVLAEHRVTAAKAVNRPSSKIAARVIICIWLLCAVLAGYFAVHAMAGR
jgi:uncharacterized membrane protein YkvA (DUF1232 family)